jgi:hypothetical protein
MAVVTDGLTTDKLVIVKDGITNDYGPVSMVCTGMSVTGSGSITNLGVPPKPEAHRAHAADLVIPSLLLLIGFFIGWVACVIFVFRRDR